MTFEQMMTAAVQSGETVVEEGWGQGRSTFGGLTAAMLLARMRTLSGALPLRSISATFAGPVAPGAVICRAELIRAGRSATFVSGQLSQGDAVRALAHVTFGAARESTIDYPPTVRAISDRDRGMVLPQVPGITPDFLQHYEMVGTSGAFPFSGAERPDYTGWMRYRDTETPFTIEHFVAMVDCWPSSVLPLLRKPAPASTITWTLTMLTDQLPDDARLWWHYSVTTDSAQDGYVSARAVICDADGRPVAVSQQSVGVFG